MTVRKIARKRPTKAKGKPLAEMELRKVSGGKATKKKAKRKKWKTIY